MDGCPGCFPSARAVALHLAQLVCPVCKKASNTQRELQECFERCSNGGSTSIWSKAMAVASSVGKKFASPEPQDGGHAAEPTLTPVPVGGSSTHGLTVDWGDQEPGVMRRRTQRFRGLRKGKTDTSDLRQNQLLLRLDKLLYDGPNENGLAAKAALKARRDYERTVVSWTEDAVVNLCPDCTKPFGMLRRKHHCRLCGSIICADCSLGLELDVCLKMLADSGVAIAGGKGDKANRQVKVTPDHAFRVCDTCVQICQKTMVSQQVQKEAEEKQKKRHVVLKMHDLLMKELAAIEERLPIYTKVAFSILRGNQLERYEWAAMERETISRQFKALDDVSQKIKVFNTASADPNSNSVRVQANIRRRIQEYLQQNMLTLVKLPDPREVERQLRERDARLAAEKEAKAAARAAAAAAAAADGADGDSLSTGGPGSASVGGRGAARHNEMFSARGERGAQGDGQGQAGRQGSAEREFANLGPRRGYGGHTGPQPAWRQSWHEISRPSVKSPSWNNDGGKTLTYVDRHAPEFEITPDEVRSETRVKMRRMLKAAQRAGALDEVEMLQMQIAELDRM